MGWFKEKATVKKFKPASKDGKQKAFAFVLLNGDKREVYVGPDILAAARVSELKPGQVVRPQASRRETRKRGSVVRRLAVRVLRGRK
jgi:cold shock CspA family protein